MRTGIDNTNACGKVQNYKAVTLDLWETILFERNGNDSRRRMARCRNLTGIFAELGVDTSIEHVNLALDKTIEILLTVWGENKDLSHINQLQSIIRIVSRNTTEIGEEGYQKLSQAYVSPLFEIPPYLNPDALQVLQWLKKQKKKIGLICNTGLTPGFGLRDLLSRLGVSEYFDVMIFSDEVGIRKPDQRIFQLAARKLKVKPLETVHIGDNLKSDVWGAQSAGFRAIHLSGTEGHDKLAEKDPKSMQVLSRNLGNLKGKRTVPDRTISRLAMLAKAIGEIEDKTA